MKLCRSVQPFCLRVWLVLLAPTVAEALVQAEGEEVAAGSELHCSLAVKEEAELR